MSFRTDKKYTVKTIKGQSPSDFLERCDRNLGTSLCKVTNVKMNDSQFLQ